MSEIQALNQQRADAVLDVEARDVAIRLSENKDFQKLVMKGFCTEECARYTHASADPALPLEARQDSLGLAQAAGHFKRFMSAVILKGNMAANNIVRIDEQLESIRMEGGDE